MVAGVTLRPWHQVFVDRNGQLGLHDCLGDLGGRIRILSYVYAFLSSAEVDQVELGPAGA